MALHGGGSERSDSALDTLYAHDIAFAGAAPHYADSLAAPSPRNDLRSALAAAASPAAADVFMTGTLQSPPAGAGHKSHAGVRAATPPPGAARAGAGAAEQRLGALLSCGPGEGPTLKQKVAAQRGCTSEGAVRRVKAPRARHPATSAAGPQRGSEGDAEGTSPRSAKRRLFLHSGRLSHAERASQLSGACASHGEADSPLRASTGRAAAARVVPRLTAPQTPARGAPTATPRNAHAARRPSALPPSPLCHITSSLEESPSKGRRRVRSGAAAGDPAPHARSRLPPLAPKSLDTATPRSLDGRLPVSAAAPPVPLDEPAGALGGGPAHCSASMQRARGERDARAGGSAADASPRYKATLARVSGQLTESLRFSRGARQPMVPHDHGSADASMDERAANVQAPEANPLQQRPGDTPRVDRALGSNAGVSPGVFSPPRCGPGAAWQGVTLGSAHRNALLEARDECGPENAADGETAAADGETAAEGGGNWSGQPLLGVWQSMECEHATSESDPNAPQLPRVPEHDNRTSSNQLRVPDDVGAFLRACAAPATPQAMPGDAATAAAFAARCAPSPARCMPMLDSAALCRPHTPRGKRCADSPLSGPAHGRRRTEPHGLRHLPEGPGLASPVLDACAGSGRGAHSRLRVPCTPMQRLRMLPRAQSGTDA